MVPRVNGKRGNPIILDWAAREEILGGVANLGCRQFIERNSERVASFDTKNDHYVVDIDSPDDICALEVRLGLKFKLPEAAASADC